MALIDWGSLFRTIQEARPSVQDTERIRKRQEILKKLEGQREEAQRTGREAEEFLRMPWYKQLFTKRTGGELKGIVKGAAKEIVGKPLAALSLLPEAGYYRAPKAASRFLEQMVTGKGYGQAKEKAAEAFGTGPTFAEKYFEYGAGKPGASPLAPVSLEETRHLVGEAATAPLLLFGGARAAAAPGASALSQMLRGGKEFAKLGPILGGLQTYEQGDIKKLPQNVALSTALSYALGFGTKGAQIGFSRLFGKAPKTGVPTEKRVADLTTALEEVKTGPVAKPKISVEVGPKKVAKIEEIIRIPKKRIMSKEGARLYEELATAQAGERYRVPSKEPGVVGEYKGVPSSFPEWIPKELRSRKLFDKVQQNLLDDTVPKTKKTKRLYDIIRGELDSRLAGKEVMAPEEAQASAGAITRNLERIKKSERQVGAIKLPGYKAPRDLEIKGVQIEKHVSKPLLTWFAPVKETLRLDPYAAQIARDGRNTYLYYSGAVLEGNERATKAFKGLTLGEKSYLVDLQERGVTDDIINNLPEKYQRALKEGLRWFPREIEKIAKSEFGIDTSKWGYTERNYFHHLLVGDQALMINGKIKAIGNQAEVLTKADELIRAGVPPASISIKPKFTQQDVPTTLLSQKGFWSFVNKMADRLGISGDEVLAEIEGVAAIKPRPRFVGAFLPRKANLQGYLKDPELVYKILWNRVQRKRFLEPFTKRASLMASKIKTPWIREYTKDYIKSVGGEYIEPLVIARMNVSKLAKWTTSIQSPLKLGYRPSTAMLNRGQPLQTAYSELGPYYFIGEAKKYTVEGKAIIDKLKLFSQQPKFATGGFEEKFMGKQALYKPLGLFSAEEQANRQVVGIGAYLKGIKAGMSEKTAIQYARDVVTATQYIYDISDLPPVFRHPIGRMALQFKPFVINYLYQAYNTLRGKPLGGLEKYEKIFYPTAASKVARAVRFLGSNFAVGGARTVLGALTPVNLGIISYAAIKKPEIFQGALSYLGIDLSKRAGASPAEILAIQDVSDLLGPGAGDIERLVRAIIKWEKSRDLKDLQDAIRIDPMAWNVYQFFSREEDVGIEPTTKERILTGLGFEPSKLSTIREALRYIDYNQPSQRTSIWRLPTKNALQNMIYNIVENEDYTDERKRQAIYQILKLYNIPESEFPKYLEARKQRMKESRQK